MRGGINDFFRGGIKCALLAFGFLLHLFFVLRARSFARTQARLRKRYGLRPETPIQSFDADLQGRLDRIRLRARSQTARTSGSTRAAKELPYSKSRIRKTAFQFVDVFARAFFFLRPRRTALFLFVPSEKDASLTSLLVDDTDDPSWIAALQAPYRLLPTAPFRALGEKYGADAVRFFLLTLTNPGVLYATNPSTLLAFFEGLEKNWPDRTRLIRDFVEKPNEFSAATHRAVRKFASRGFAGRAGKIAASPAFLPVGETIPAVDLYSCWTGGYVAPFLEKLETYLPRERYRLLPMYSMSTETVETIADCSSGSAVFLPLARGVLYEFLEEGNPDDPSLLRTELEIGKSYSLVVSDGYGLKRYQTEDLFRCEGFARGLPNLSFQRRRDLEYSLTGEKITARQLEEVYSRLLPGRPLTCFPSWPPDERPHYKIIVVSETTVAPPDLERLAVQAESELSEMNSEYRSKVASGRLGPVRIHQASWAELVRRATGRDEAPAQFKTLPLYRKLWESCELA